MQGFQQQQQQQQKRRQCGAQLVLFNTHAPSCNTVTTRAMSAHRAPTIQFGTGRVLSVVLKHDFQLFCNASWTTFRKQRAATNGNVFARKCYRIRLRWISWPFLPSVQRLEKVCSLAAWWCKVTLNTDKKSTVESATIVLLYL